MYDIVNQKLVREFDLKKEFKELSLTCRKSQTENNSLLGINEKEILKIDPR